MRNLIISGVLIIIGIVVLSQTCYVVDETEQVIVTRFGDVRSVQENPGLKAKVPFVDSVVRFDRRLLRIDADAEAMRDIEKQDLTIDSYARYKIIDPVQFRKTLITAENAVSRLGDIVNSTLRERIALRTRSEIIGARPVLDEFGAQAEDEEGLPLFEGTESRSSLLAEVGDGVRLRVIAQEINREIPVPDLRGDATFDLPLEHLVLDADNSDRDGDLNTGVSQSDIRVQAGPGRRGNRGPGLGGHWLGPGHQDRYLRRATGRDSCRRGHLHHPVLQGPRRAPGNRDRGREDQAGGLPRLGDSQHFHPYAGRA